MKKLPLLFVTGILAASLSGCMSMSEYRKQVKLYDDSKSYASNVVRQFWASELKDTAVPKGTVSSNSMLGFDVSMATLAELSGGTSIYGGVGLNLGMSLLRDMSKDPPVDMQPHLIAYVDADKFPNRSDAETEAVHQARQALIKGVQDLGLSPVEKWSPKPHERSLLWRNWVGSTLFFENEALGCPKISHIDDPYDRRLAPSGLCHAEIQVEHWSESKIKKTEIPSWMNNPGSLAWPIALKSSVVIKLPASTKLKDRQILIATAKHLPNNYWLYVQPKYNKEQKTVLAPLLLNNQGVHLFCHDSQKK